MQMGKTSDKKVRLNDSGAADAEKHSSVQTSDWLPARWVSVVVVRKFMFSI